MEIIREKGPFVTVEEGEKIRVGLSASMRAPGLIDSFNLRATRQPWSPYADPGLFAMSGGSHSGLILLGKYLYSVHITIETRWMEADFITLNSKGTISTKRKNQTK
ncbi:hypothetical protein ACN38_g4008 [Penicillium nordicum]|uniref:Uncharacterized protein n=1 Tax=Penicillium nordicum TaxID=229535 RepID=A0A0N0RZC9_9EURO|nr:hypothetical protein ACN38_g4008 [Penicillium nordicum]